VPDQEQLPQWTLTKSPIVTYHLNIFFVHECPICIAYPLDKTTPETTRLISFIGVYLYDHSQPLPIPIAN